MAMSPFKSSIVSPISKVPYDVLREIFIHCLPRYRLKTHLQPNTKVSPMLLCQICSAWRTVALNSPTLWSHLPYVLLRVYNEGQDNGFNFKIPRNQWAFLSWWMQNQGTMAPSLCFNVAWISDEEPRARGPGLDANEMMSLVKYIASARYLEIDEVFWFLLGEWNNIGKHDIYPNPHTFVKFGSNETSYFYWVQRLIQDRTPPALRHLSFSSDVLSNNFLIPNHWTHLTHVAFEDVTLPLSVWYSFIRSVPNLIWGHFDIDIALSETEHVAPTKCILEHLSTFFLSLWSVSSVERSFMTNFPLSTLFAHLHLPVLHTLSLFSDQLSWRDHRGVADLYTILDSTPAITTLTLSEFVLASNDYLTRILPGIGVVEPVWCRTPLLNHLRLDLPGHNGQIGNTVARIRNHFIPNLFHCDNHWLGLDDPSCSIRKITMIDWTRLGGWGDMIKHLIQPSILEYERGAPNNNIVFEVSSHSEEPTAAGPWNEWGPNLIY